MFEGTTGRADLDGVWNDLSELRHQVEEGEIPTRAARETALGKAVGGLADSEQRDRLIVLILMAEFERIRESRP